MKTIKCIINSVIYRIINSVIYRITGKVLQRITDPNPDWKTVNPVDEKPHKISLATNLTIPHVSIRNGGRILFSLRNKIMPIKQGHC